MSRAPIPIEIANAAARVELFALDALECRKPGRCYRGTRQRAPALRSRPADGGAPQTTT